MVTLGGTEEDGSALSALRHIFTEPCYCVCVEICSEIVMFLNCSEEKLIIRH